MLAQLFIKDLSKRVSPVPSSVNCCKQPDIKKVFDQFLCRERTPKTYLSGCESDWHLSNCCNGKHVGSRHSCFCRPCVCVCDTVCWVIYFSVSPFEGTLMVVSREHCNHIFKLSSYKRFLCRAFGVAAGAAMKSRLQVASINTCMLHIRKQQSNSLHQNICTPQSSSTVFTLWQ